MTFSRGQRTREYQEILRGATRVVADRGEDAYRNRRDWNPASRTPRRPTLARTLLVKRTPIGSSTADAHACSSASERQYWDGAVDWESGDSVFRRDASPDLPVLYASTAPVGSSLGNTPLLERGGAREQFIAGSARTLRRSTSFPARRPSWA